MATIKVNKTEFFFLAKDAVIYLVKDKNLHCCYRISIPAKDGSYDHYVGSSVNVYDRPFLHGRRLSGNKHGNNVFQTAFNKRDKSKAIKFQYLEVWRKPKNKSYKMCDIEQRETDKCIKKYGLTHFLGKTDKISRVKK